MTKATTEAQLKEALRQFTGTETWYRHPLFRTFCYTEGVQYLAEQAGAYWLISDILACQDDPRVKAQGFQEWKLMVNEDRSAVLTCADGDLHIVYSQDYGFTDFPLQSCKLWLTNAVLLLPSEY
jgi:hypothetical protein